MLQAIITLTSFTFALTYPLCFWISAKDPLKQGFSKFHMSLPLFVGGVLAVLAWTTDFPANVKYGLLFWVSGFALIVAYSWNKDSPSPFLISLPSFAGIGILPSLLTIWNIGSAAHMVVTLLSGLVLSAAFYAMNLGHWYLNVHGLDLKHMSWAFYTLWVLLGIRFLWIFYCLIFLETRYLGDLIPLWSFSMTVDGFLIWMGIFFGTLFPLGGLFLARETLRLKNTQATTGILYALLAAVLLGDLSLKYYHVYFSIPV